MTAIEKHYQNEAFRQAKFEAFLVQDLREAEQWAAYRDGVEAEYREEARRERADSKSEYLDSIERNFQHCW